MLRFCDEPNEIINFSVNLFSRFREKFHADNLHFYDASSDCNVHKSNQSYRRRPEVSNGGKFRSSRIKESFSQLGSPEVKFVTKASIPLRSAQGSPQIR